MTTCAPMRGARLEAPSNLFVKGYIGGGRTNNGHLNDEDFVIQLTPTVLAAYSNTLSSEVTGTTGYGVIDGGFDVLRAPGYSVGLFAGYFYFHQHMDAFGCTPVASINCIPAAPASGSAIITEDDKWSALRIGIAAETMLSERVKLSGEVAYLPYVKFTGADNHFFGNSGALAEQFAEWGVGRGVQLEAIVSYIISPRSLASAWEAATGQCGPRTRRPAAPMAPMDFATQRRHRRSSSGPWSSKPA